MGQGRALVSGFPVEVQLAADHTPFPTSHCSHGSGCLRLPCRTRGMNQDLDFPTRRWTWDPVDEAAVAGGTGKKYQAFFQLAEVRKFTSWKPQTPPTRNNVKYFIKFLLLQAFMQGLTTIILKP